MLQSRSRFPVVTSAATDLRPQRLVLTSCYRLSLAALSPRLTCADAEPPWGDRVAVEAAKRDLAGVSQLGDIGDPYASILADGMLPAGLATMA
jgi:hypothetical protein